MINNRKERKTMFVNIPCGLPYVRGQVWFVREPYRVTEAKINSGTKVMAKSRPYLVYLSERDARLKFNVVQAFPISSNNKMTNDEKRRFYDFDIRFVNPQNGEIHRIITGQLTTIDTSCMERYMFTLPSELMMKIDRLMVRRFGITPDVFNSTDNNETKSPTPNVGFRGTVDEGKSEISERSDEITPSSKESLGENKKQPGNGRKYRQRTPELAEEFIKDFDIIKDRTKLAEKWGYSLSSLYKTRQNVVSFLKNNKE